MSAFSAIASPLPATIPGTRIASLAYLHEGLYEKKIIYWSIAVGLPTTLLGAYLSKYVGGVPLLIVSNLVLIFLSISFLYSKIKRPGSGKPSLQPSNADLQQPQIRIPLLVLVAATVGMI